MYTRTIHHFSPDLDNNTRLGAATAKAIRKALASFATDGSLSDMLQTMREIIDEADAQLINVRCSIQDE